MLRLIRRITFVYISVTPTILISFTSSSFWFSPVDSSSSSSSSSRPERALEWYACCMGWFFVCLCPFHVTRVRSMYTHSHVIWLCTCINEWRHRTQPLVGVREPRVYVLFILFSSSFRYNSFGSLLSHPFERMEMDEKELHVRETKDTQSDTIQSCSMLSMMTTPRCVNESARICHINQGVLCVCVWITQVTCSQIIAYKWHQRIHLLRKIFECIIDLFF